MLEGIAVAAKSGVHGLQPVLEEIYVARTAVYSPRGGWRADRWHLRGARRPERRVVSCFAQQTKGRGGGGPWIKSACQLVPENTRSAPLASDRPPGNSPGLVQRQGESDRRKMRIGVCQCARNTPNDSTSPTHKQSGPDWTAGEEPLRGAVEEVGRGTADVEDDSFAVRVAVAMLRFYKREISPWLPGSCRYVPTCSEYAIQSYKKYGPYKGTVLTACRLARCNPLGGSGFDPPRWFDEPRPPPY